MKVYNVIGDCRGRDVRHGSRVTGSCHIHMPSYGKMWHEPTHSLTHPRTLILTQSHTQSHFPGTLSAINAIAFKRAHARHQIQWMLGSLIPVRFPIVSSALLSILIFNQDSNTGASSWCNLHRELVGDALHRGHRNQDSRNEGHSWLTWGARNSRGRY